MEWEGEGDIKNSSYIHDLPNWRIILWWYLLKTKRVPGLGKDEVELSQFQHAAVEISKW